MKKKNKVAWVLIVGGGITLIKSVPIVIATRRINRDTIAGALDVFEGVRLLIEEENH